MGGVVFDYYGPDNFKFAAIDAAADKILIGHYTDKSGWVTDASFGMAIDVDTDYVLNLSLKGTTVSASAKKVGAQNWQGMAGFVFNAVTVDGDFGLLSKDGSSSFDSVKVKTNDPAFAPSLTAAAAPAVQAEAASALTYAQLDDIIEEARDRWTESLGGNVIGQAALDQVTFQIVNFGDLTLGKAIGASVLIDLDGAGWGWFVDATPVNDVEFGLKLSDVEKMALETSPAFGRMDLLTVVMHEVGHLLGYQDLDSSSDALMGGTPDAGTRRLNDGAQESPKLVQMDSVTAGGVDPLLWGTKDNKASWLEDLLVDLAGTKDNPFDPTGKFKISISGGNAAARKKQN